MRTSARTSSITYTSWVMMKQRCHNPNATGYHNYGGRGIVVCQRWRESFEAFVADVGERPSKSHSLDRYPDNDGNYEPGNVRWATRKQQCVNRCWVPSMTIEHDGEIGSQAYWSRRLRISQPRLSERMAKGQTIADLIAEGFTLFPHEDE